jgi:hypothetical protein
MLQKIAFLVCILSTFFLAMVRADSFTYYPPGSLLPKTGSRAMSTGHADYAVHVPDMLFPLEEGGFPNSPCIDVTFTVK